MVIRSPYFCYSNQAKFYRIYSETTSCSTEGYYCWSNGVDWAACDTSIGMITNSEFQVINNATACEAGRYMGTLKAASTEARDVNTARRAIGSVASRATMVTTT